MNTKVSAKSGIDRRTAMQKRQKMANAVRGRNKEKVINEKRGICQAADDLYDRYGEAKANGNDAVTAWRAALIQAYRDCKTSKLDMCDPSEVGDLMDLLADIKLDQKRGYGEGKMVGGNNPIEQLFKLNSWLVTHQAWSTCAKWFLTQIWEKCCELYGSASEGIAYAIGIIKDVGFTALGHTDTKTFEFTAAAFYYLYSAGSGALDAAANKATPYFNAIEKNVKDILVENKNNLSAKMPGVVTPQQFQEWLDNTTMVNKIYWTLVTLKSYQAGPLIAATLTTTGSIIMSASYYGVLMAYYITSSNYFTFALLTSAAGKSVYDKLSSDNQNLIKDLFNKFDKFISDKALGAEVDDLTSMMSEIKKLPEEAKKFALEQAKLQNKLTKSILTNAETNEELGKILRTKDMEAKIADVEQKTREIQEQIERLEEEKDNKDMDEDLDLGGKRRTRKRGKRHSKRAPRKTKTLRKKRRGKK